ncbi:hypothetical protein D3C76_1749950 [compost metagenome]
MPNVVTNSGRAYRGHLRDRTLADHVLSGSDQAVYEVQIRNHLGHLAPGQKSGIHERNSANAGPWEANDAGCRFLCAVLRDGERRRWTK